MSEEEAALATTRSAPGGAVTALEDSALSVEQMKRQKEIIEQVMAAVMVKGKHYGTIPGCGNELRLKKAGAEVLARTFRLAPEYEINEAPVEGFPGHIDVMVKTRLVHIPTGNMVGMGVGSCSTMEGKYRFRNAGRVCPECERENTIIKSKPQYGGGWVCYEKKGGCGAEWTAGAEAIEGQLLGKVENPNPAEHWNTARKMAKKRSYSDAVQSTLAASDVFPEVSESDDRPRPEQAPPNQRGNTQGSPPATAPSDQKNGSGDLNAKKNQISAAIRKLQPDGTTWNDAMAWMAATYKRDLNALNPGDEHIADLVLADLGKGDRCSMVSFLKKHGGGQG